MIPESIATIECSKREKTGKVESARLRAMQKVPGIVYCKDKQKTVAIALDRLMAERIVEDYAFMNKALFIKIDDTKMFVIPREVQFHPVTDWPVHFDFMEIEETERVNVKVPVSVVNRELSPGVRRGGEVIVVNYTVCLNVEVTKIPHEIVVDVSGDNIGTKYLLSMLPMPDNTKIVRDCLVAKISGKRGKVSAIAEAGGGASNTAAA